PAYGAHVRQWFDEHERSELPKARIAWGATPAHVRYPFAQARRLAAAPWRELRTQALGQPSTPRCSSRIFSPIKIKIMPPASSALLLYLAPNRLPTFTPTMDNAKVITPIKLTAAPMFTLKKAKLTPTAR